MGRRTGTGGPRQKYPPELIAKAHAEAEFIGVAAAAMKYGIKLRTFEMHRARITAQCGGKKSTDWRLEAEKAQLELLRRTVELANVSDNLRDVAGALKIVSDAILAENVVNDGGQPDTSASVEGEGYPDPQVAVDGESEPVDGEVTPDP